MTKVITEIEKSTPQENGVMNTPNALIQLAIQKDVDVDKLEKLLQLQERWQANEAKKIFLESVSKFQNECPVLEKKKKVAFGTTKYSYAPLGEIFLSIKDKLREHGLSYRWEMKDEAASIICTCIVSHVSGHAEQTSMSAGKDASGGKNEIQQRGSTITYLQRYTLIAALGISTADEDVDGQREENKPQQAPVTKPQAAKSEVDVKPIPPVKKKVETIEQTLTEDQESYLTEKIRDISEAKSKTDLMDWAKIQKDWVKINTRFREAVSNKAKSFVEIIPEKATPAPLAPEVAAQHAEKESYFALPWMPEAVFKESLAQIDAGNCSLFPELEKQYRIKAAYKSALEQSHEFSLKVQ